MWVQNWTQVVPWFLTWIWWRILWPFVALVCIQEAISCLIRNLLVQKIGVSCVIVFPWPIDWILNIFRHQIYLNLITGPIKWAFTIASSSCLLLDLWLTFDAIDWCLHWQNIAQGFINSLYIFGESSYLGLVMYENAFDFFCLRPSNL